MNNRQIPIYTPSEGPPSERPNPAIYKAMGEENIFLMLKDFYLELGRSTIREMFPENLELASKKSAAFFVFLLGGPPMYQELYGPPMMRKRHLPFQIDEGARQVWLACFAKTLENADIKYHFPVEYLDNFWQFLDKFSSWMVNTPPPKTTAATLS